MIDLSYEYYKNDFGGTLLDEDTFYRLRMRTFTIASSILVVDILKMTVIDFDDLELTLLKQALCAAIECVSTCLSNGSAATAAVVTGESVAGVWSKTYADTSSDKDKSSNTKTYDAVRDVLTDYLACTSLMRRGYFING